MWNFAKKLAIAGVSTLLTATAGLSAANGDCDYNCNNRSDSNSCCGDWSFEAEVLYWRTNVDELPVGRHFSSCVSAPVSINVPGDGTISVTRSECEKFFTKYLDFDWRPGSRLTIGYKSPCYCWDFNATWTWLHSNASASLSDAAPFDTSFIEPAWRSGATPPFDFALGDPNERTRIKADWGMSYNTVELGFGYTFFACCDQFSLRPHFDLKIASIRQRFTHRTEREYQGLPTTPSGGFIPFTTSDDVFVSRDYLGIGPQIGLDFTYHICGGLSFYGKAAAALLYAEPEISFRGKFETNSFDNSALVYDNNGTKRSRTDPRQINFNSSLGAGLAYSRWVCDCCYRLTFKLGWEHHFYTEQNQIHRAVFSPVAFNDPYGDIFIPVEQGNLSLYGLTASIGLDY